MRAERSDKGQMRVTERDLFAFEWLVDMKAVYVDDLAVLLGRFGGQRPGDEAMRKIVGRWQRAGYARAQKVMADRPRMVVLEALGAALVGEPDYRAQSPWTAYHSCEVARVRLWMEQPDSDTWSGDWAVTEWLSERRFRAEKWEQHPKDGTKGMHVPDAVVTFANGIVAAIEVERTDKTARRLTEILSRLSAYQAVIYCAQAKRIRDHVEAVWQAATRKPALLRTYPYPEELER